MSETRTISLTMRYKNTDFTRKYQFTVGEDITANTLRTNVQNYNDNLSDKDKNIFVSDDYDASDPEEIIGTLEAISAAELRVTTTTNIPLY